MTGLVDGYRKGVVGILRLPTRKEAAQIAVALCCFVFPVLFIPLASQDDGVDRWVRVGLRKSVVKKVVMAEGPPPLLFALREAEGVYRSTDDGRTWVAANSGLPADHWGRVRVQTIAAGAANPSVIYAGTDRLEYRGDGPSSGLYVTDDNGATWLGPKQDVPDGEVQAIAAVYVPAAGGVICVATVSGIYRSTDEGQSWSRLDWRGVDVRILSLAVHPDNLDTIYVGTDGGGLYRTENGGISWKAMNQGLDDLDVRDIAVSGIAPDLIYLGTSGGAYKSTNGGTAWTKLAGATGGRHVGTVLVHPHDETVVFTGLQHGGVHCSVDGGISWTPLKRGLGNLTVWSLTLDPQNTAVLWAGTGDGIWRYVFRTSPPLTAPSTHAATPATAEPPRPTRTVSPLPTVTASPTELITPTAVQVRTSAPSPTWTHTLSPTATHTPRPSPTSTASLMPTSTAAPARPSPTSVPAAPTDTPAR